MSDRLQHQPDPRDSLVRGDFSDGHTDFTVRASSSHAPDSFQVSANRNPADLVLIVSGLNSGNLHATWGDEWRAFAPDWKVWVEDAAFEVFYNGDLADTRRDGGPGPVKFCNG
ncbi:hypothetical protein K3N28_08875 [Glycomyces sp. TRM65418]|uniref:hypothetical protein n=1 Tax=Glycomyces sp. TRM65418 TaxID=2867006 RepID=UPI001CE64C97|nr:hypothetical protein [Glycomyces sp. TRM65418]MCC3763182.1 hypothetical protein [Glycomyces sp. TRM65418]QZD57187.1 hypothetical protein K3N28_08815 [Glycomyces sp. TRM65418]